MPMKKRLFSAGAACAGILALMAALPASAADSAIGRITYIYPDGRRLILDSSREFALAPNVDAAQLRVAEFVRLTLGANNQVTKVSPGPADKAGTWPSDS